MESRENALQEALVKNAEETERWKKYILEIEKTIENLDMFSKHLTVEVMVPVGSKAFMPGQLIYTNQVLVAHYQGYFSKCSAHKAKEICEHRKQNANEHLQMLQAEAVFWQNKLEKPHMEGVFANGDQYEIIEEFDEEKEKLWKDQHKLNIKKNKLLERTARKAMDEQSITEEKAKEDEKSSLTNEVISQMFENRNKIEEIAKEINLVDDPINVRETLDKLRFGEIIVPAEKKRIAHNLETKKKTEQSEGSLNKIEDCVNKPINSMQLKSKTDNLQEIVHKTDMIESSTEDSATHTIIQSTTQNSEFAEIESFGSELTDAAKKIKTQAEFLCPEDQIDFYEYQMEIIQKKLKQLKPMDDQEGKRFFDIFFDLQTLQESVMVALGNEELAATLENESVDSTTEAAATTDEVVKTRDKVLQNTNKSVENTSTVAETTTAVVEENGKQDKSLKSQRKRRITFALTDDILEFRTNEAVTQMLPKADVNSNNVTVKRDIIKLDELIIAPTPKNPLSAKNRQQMIIDRVDQNWKFVSETQSEQDAYMIDKINARFNDNIKTLHISFKHSVQFDLDIANAPVVQNEEEERVPTTPADFYNIYVKQKRQAELAELFVKSYKGQATDDVRTPLLRESDRPQAYKDPKSKFSVPGALALDEESNEVPNHSVTFKSILRNKEAVQKEWHIRKYHSNNLNTIHNKKNRKNEANDKQCEQTETTSVADFETSTFNMVVSEVVERKETEIVAPEPLPQGKFIDAHAPKKRISRFKQMRAGIGNTTEY